VSIEAMHDAVGRFAEADSTAGDRVKDRLDIRWRLADDSQNFRRRSLLIERHSEIAIAGFQLLEEPHILNRNDRLVGEGLE